MTREEAIKILKSGSTFAYDEKEAGEFCEAYDMAITALEAQDVDAVSRHAVMWILTNLSYTQCKTQGEADVIDTAKTMVMTMPSAQPERIWHSCGEPPKHHKYVLVRGIEAIGNVTVHKVMQWDVDRWRPTDYAPSIVWQEWSEI